MGPLQACLDELKELLELGDARQGLLALFLEVLDDHLLELHELHSFAVLEEAQGHLPACVVALARQLSDRPLPAILVPLQSGDLVLHRRQLAAAFHQRILDVSRCHLALRAGILATLTRLPTPSTWSFCLVRLPSPSSLLHCSFGPC